MTTRLSMSSMRHLQAVARQIAPRSMQSKITPTRSFYDSAALYTNTKRSAANNLAKDRPPKTRSEHVEIPEFSFQGLGATRPVKIVLYTSLAILGTLETIFYGRWIYHYFYPDSTPAATHYLKGLYRYFFPSQPSEPESEPESLAKKS